MASVNKAIIVGTVGRDPETRYSQNGEVPITTLSVATSRYWRNQAGERQEETEWHRIVFFRRLAEIAQQYLRKGSSVYVEGRVATRKYTDKQGVERYTTEIVAESMQMLGGRRDDMNQGAPSAPQAAAPQTAQPQQSQPAAAPAYDDIPF